jgi:hypothetical protein
VARDVGKIEILWADELDWWAFEHSVVFFTNVTCIFYGLLEDIVDVLIARDQERCFIREDEKIGGAYSFGADDSDIIFV